MSTKTIDFAQGFQTNLDESVLMPAKNVTVETIPDVAADDVQEALEKLKEDIDTRALDEDTYSIDEVDDALDLKADKSDTYTKSQVDGKIADLVNSAPAILDTLGEISEALNNDQNFAATMTTALAGKVDIASPSMTAALEMSEVSTPSTPSAGKRKLYPKADGIYQLDSDGVETKVGSGAGGAAEINVISNPSAESDVNGWVSSGAGVTVDRTTTSSDLPLAGILASAIKITPVSGSDYIRYRWTMPEALKNRKLKVEWHQRPLSGYASGDLKVEIHTNSANDYSGTDTTHPLSTDASGVSGIPNATGKFTTTFDANSSDYYELRIIRTAGTTALNLASVIVGPGIQPQGAIVGSDLSFIPSWGNLTLGNGTTTGFYRRVGTRMEGIAYLNFGSSTSLSGILTLTIPDSKTIDTTKLGTTAAAREIVGIWNVKDSGAQNYFGQMTYASTTTIDLAVAGASSQVNATTPITFGTGDVVEVRFDIPIAEWAGSGTLNVAGTNDEEFGSNSSTNDADDTTSFVYGSSGSPVPGALTASRRKRIRFHSPIQATDLLVLEWSSNSGINWFPITSNNMGSVTYQNQNGTEYGMYFSEVSGSLTDVDVFFARYMTPASTYGAAGNAWSNAGGVRKFRVRKIANGKAVGFGAATATEMGLYKAGQAPGTPTNDNAQAGNVGEYVESYIAGSGPNASSGAVYALTSITLTPGDWDISAGVTLNSSSAITTANYVQYGIFTTFGSMSSGRYGSNYAEDAFFKPSAINVYQQKFIPRYRVSVAATTTYYLNASVSYSGGQMSFPFSFISARRVR